MKIIFLSLLFLFGCFSTESSRPNDVPMNDPSKPFIYQFKLKTLDGKELSLEKYKGKKLLIVNTASECGYTPQYEDLQKLQEKYPEKLEILGFPCNDFGGQEPGSASEIQQFCKKNYGVTFQMFEKITVKGPTKHPLYQWLSDKKWNGWNDKEPTWNFCKYLIDENGALLKFYGSGVKPMSEEVIKAIEQ